MNKHLRWLAEQLPRWVAQGLLSPEQAEGIRKLYPEPKAALPWGTIIFSGMGAVLLGLGVILLFAYNWQAMPKAAKLAVIFVALGGAQAAGIKLFLGAGWQRQLGEAICLLGTMFFGAGIWLVAQIYHIQEHYPSGFLVWGIGALAMAWALPSLAHGLLALAALCIWDCTEASEFSTPVHWAPLLILFGAGALAWWRRWRWLLFFTLAGFVIALLANAGELRSGLLLPVSLNLAAAFIAAGILIRSSARLGDSAPFWSFYGWLGFLVCVFLLSFAGWVCGLMEWSQRAAREGGQAVWLYLWGPSVLMCLAWGAVLRAWARAPGPEGRASLCPLENWLAPLAAVVCQLLFWFGMRGWGATVAGVFNLVFLAVAASWMARGCRQAEWRPTVLGSALLAALATARYFDLFESLAARGVVFLLVGGVLFAEGILYTRARRRLKATEAL